MGRGGGLASSCFPGGANFSASELPHWGSLGDALSVTVTLSESLLASAEDARALAALLEEHWDFISRSPALVERLQESAACGAL